MTIKTAANPKATLQQDVLIEGLLQFLQASPTPFHAVAQMSQRLCAAGFTPLEERDDWSLKPGKGYFVQRNGSSIIAFRTGTRDPLDAGIRMLGAHTDSPCLKVKPRPEMLQLGSFQLGVEVYGGALLNPWFDRDLSIAGRVTWLDAAGQQCDSLIDFQRPVAIVPSLAIHLDREANQSRSINNQKDLPPLLMLHQGQEKPDFRTILREQMAHEYPELSAAKAVKQVLDYELCLYDTQPAALIGLQQEFIAAARLDNLLSCYLGLQALLCANDRQPALLVCSDHEEVGSMSAEGAQGNFVSDLLARWLGQAARPRVMAASMLISADNAHAVHPNFADRHEQNHGPQLKQGPVIKVNHSQRYATNSRTASYYRHLSSQLGLPCQSFVVRSDMACGSTIGPLSAASLGVKTLDIGVPQLAMHSIRELAAAADAYYLYQAFNHYFNDEVLP